MKKTAKYILLHFKPIELYPPAINLIDYFGNHTQGTFLVATTCPKHNLKLYNSSSLNITIRRYPAIEQHSILRLFSYASFYLGSLLLLLKYRPATVLYFESISSWPALVYKRLRGKKVKLMAHYHEYTSPSEYAGSMRLVKHMHKMEKKMYRHYFDWISHTNEIRLADFKKDNGLTEMKKDIFFTLPNYPSTNWAGDVKRRLPNDNIKLVYIGALGYDTMYVKETLEWVRNSTRLTLDLYANIIDEKAAAFIEGFACNRIRFHGGINYMDIPNMMKHYDVGLVMYKPFNENTINAVSNKLFEYLACGLDVWFSEEMTYTAAFIRSDVYPKVLPVNFNHLNTFDYQHAFSKEGIQYEPTAYYYEKNYYFLDNKMKNQ